MKNSNENTAKYYDIVNSYIKGSDISNFEIGLINKYFPPKSHVLDIGGGSGRHAITLASLGFKVEVVDSSFEMLNLLKQKVSQSNDKTQNNIKLHNNNIFKFDTKSKYDLIIMFWNTFNEIALTKKDAVRLLNKCKRLLKDNGRIIINIDDSKNIDPSNFNFTSSNSDKNFKYDLKWKTYKYFKRTNTSISKEEIIVTSLNNDSDTKTYTSYIKQRYWSLEEIKNLAKRTHLSLSIDEIKNIKELYLIFKN